MSLRSAAQCSVRCLRASGRTATLYETQDATTHRLRHQPLRSEFRVACINKHPSFLPRFARDFLSA
eukprot:803641-Rhodomonas_salina.1